MSIDDVFTYPQNGQTWGNWKLSTRELVLKYTGEGGYEVDLEEMTSSANVLDWIAQVSQKAWASAEDVGNFVRAINDIFELQQRLCPAGADRRLDASQFLRTRYPLP